MKFHTLLGLLALSSASSHAMIGIESFSSVSLGKVTADNFSASSTVLHYAQDASLVMGLGPLDVGFGGAVRYVDQISTVTSAEGNFSGLRWEIFPIAGLSFGDIAVHFEPILIGKYSLSKKNPSGNEVVYNSPIGARVFITKSLGQLLFFANCGISFLADYTSYKKVNLDGNTSDLTNKLKVWSVGLALHLRLL